MVPEGAECSPSIRIASGTWNHAHPISVSSANLSRAVTRRLNPGTLFVTKSEHHCRGARGRESGSLGDGVDLVGDEPVSFAMHGCCGVGVWGVD